jgi:myo-inositol-1(or 4)-monophosphatase
MSDLNLLQTTHLSRSIVKEAGDQLRSEWKLARTATQKDVRDLATQYDQIIEERIAKSLTELFPDHSVYGEEVTKKSKESDYAWYIDPIDGTKYFAADIPLFTVSLGLTHRGKPVMGVVYNPISNQMYSGFQASPAKVNYEDLKVATPRPITQSVIYADLSKFETLNQNNKQWIKDKYFDILNNTYRVRSFGCGSLGLAWIASGNFDAFIDFTGRTKFYDVCAGIAILESAGGTYEYLKVDNRRHFLAANHPNTLQKIKTLLTT